MTTARDLLTRSFRLARIVGEIDTPSATQLSDALSDLNELIETWSNQRGFIYDIQTVGPFSTVAGTASYAVGASATWDTTRPLQEPEGAFIRLGSVDYGLTFRPMEWYNGLSIKAVQARPTYASYERSYSSGTIWLWATPDAVYSVYLSIQRQLSSLATLDTAFSCPPGYLRALRYVMACDLAPQYNLPVDPRVENTKNDAVAAIKRTNAPLSFSGYDDALLARPTFNYNIGQ